MIAVAFGKPTADAPASNKKLELEKYYIDS